MSMLLSHPLSPLLQNFKSAVPYPQTPFIDLGGPEDDYTKENNLRYAREQSAYAIATMVEMRKFLASGGVVCFIIKYISLYFDL